MRDELLDLTDALKGHILSEKESGSGISRLYLKGDPGAVSSMPVDTMPNNGVICVPSETLEDIRAELGDCTRCKLHSGRNNIIFGEGNPRADLVFVGEAPGRDEDRQGRPFVGRAGQLLTDIIKAMGLTRDEVYICNILKCRPPKNRNPETDEITMCEPFLVKQLQSIQPRVICALGKFAAQTLLKTDTAISVLRGRFHSYHGIRLMPTYHPAYLLRNPGAKKKVWEDVQMIMKELQQEP
ncbi:MAG: uracil-DNA glycosylase [Deltaproteobacteria bacterium]|nr:uracil-DNA glycosylase [Deltaproteobacteria bacterium]MBW2673969.1 uracil-DNA glycosylase [Deltaproteobacteria bacterium]